MDASGTDYAHDDSLLEDPTEGTLVRRVVSGIVGGMVFFSIVGIIMMRVGAPDWGWSSAIWIGLFGGFWAGLFFGAAAGNATHLIKSGDH